MRSCKQTGKHDPRPRLCVLCSAFWKQRAGAAWASPQLLPPHASGEQRTTEYGVFTNRRRAASCGGQMRRRQSTPICERAEQVLQNALFCSVLRSQSPIPWFGSACNAPSTETILSSTLMACSAGLEAHSIGPGQGSPAFTLPSHCPGEAHGAIRLYGAACPACLSCMSLSLSLPFGPGPVAVYLLRPYASSRGETCVRGRARLCSEQASSEETCSLHHTAGHLRVLVRCSRALFARRTRTPHVTVYEMRLTLDFLFPSPVLASTRYMRLERSLQGRCRTEPNIFGMLRNA